MSEDIGSEVERLEATIRELRENRQLLLDHNAILITERDSLRAEIVSLRQMCQDLRTSLAYYPRPMT